MSIEFHETKASARNSGLKVHTVNGQKLGVLSEAGNGTWNSVLTDTNSAKSTGRWLFEVHWWWFIDGPDSYWAIGLVEGDDLPPTTEWIGGVPGAAALYLDTGNIHRNNTVVKSGGSRIAEVSTFSMLYDADTRDIWFAKDGTLLYGSGDPVAGTDPHYTLPGTAAQEPAMSGYRYNSGQMLASSPSLPMLYSWDGYTPWGLTLHDVTIPAADKAFYQSGGVVKYASQLIRYSIYAGAGILAEPIATGSFTTDASGLMPAVQVIADTVEVSGYMVWHVDGADPSKSAAIRPVTLAAA